VNLHGVEVALARRGHGAPLLFLQSEDGIEADAPLVDALARDFELIIPDPPGFGASPESPRITTIDDIAYLYLDLLDALDVTSIPVIGCSLGGWIAAEMATKSCERIGRIALIGAYGIKVGGTFARDIADIYVLSRTEVTARTYADGTRAPDYAAMDDAVVERIARNRLATVKYGWEPYMHNPKLKDRLHRIAVPALVLWGAQDRIVAPDYGRAYAAAIPGARFELIDAAGHLPHWEQPDRVVSSVRAFLGSNA
jgi:pimeloyl-ACP methyl ester carboxylesterase